MTDEPNDNHIYNTNMFSYHGRIGRLRFFGISLLLYLVSALMLFLFEIVRYEASVIVIAYVVWIVLIVISVFNQIKRLHDLKKPGWLWILMFVPLVNLIFGLYLLLWPSAWTDEELQALSRNS